MHAGLGVVGAELFSNVMSTGEPAYCHVQSWERKGLSSRLQAVAIWTHLRGPVSDFAPGCQSQCSMRAHASIRSCCTSSRKRVKISEAVRYHCYQASIKHYQLQCFS